MKTNKMLPDSSISKVWENFRKMNGIVIELLASNWVSQSNGTFTNTVSYEGFTSDEILEVDLYDDGTLTETQISEYDGYITEFNVEDGKIVAIATTLPTQPIKILVRGEIVGKMIVSDGGSSNVSASDISCLDKDGQTSNIQKELDEQNKNFDNRIGFPDYSRVLDDTTLKVKGGTYTATENCWVIGIITTRSKDYSVYILVDDVKVLSFYVNPNSESHTCAMIPVKKGSVVKTSSENGDYYLSVYAMN